MPHQNANHIEITRMFVIDIEIYFYKVILFCTYELINLRYFLFNIVMATVPITSQITTFKDNRTDSDTDLSIVNTKDEIHTDLSIWAPAERKKQHMTEFHEEYQCVFGEKASIHTIMKHRLSHMNPPIPKSVCEEEMQNANLDTNEVIIEYITDAQGNKIKKLKPLLIKSEPNREYVQHIASDDNPPAVPEEKFIQKREVTVDSYSETISSIDESSDDRTITADSNSSAALSFKETPCKWEADSQEIEATLYQIAMGLQSAAERYLTLAAHISTVTPYELPHIIAQIPPPMDVPMPIGKALLVDGESKAVNYLIHGEYELNKTSWSKLQKKYNISKNKIYATLKGKGRPQGSQYRQRKKQTVKTEATALTSHSETVND